MSRTNHYYLCEQCYDEENRCKYHPLYTEVRGAFRINVPFDAVIGEIPDGCYVRYTYFRRNEPIKPIRWIDGRRPWQRRPRFPSRGSPKSYHNPPPRWWWAEAHAHARRVQDREIRRAAADEYESLSMTKERKLINLRSWY
jgi:hypothetical protein